MHQARKITINVIRDGKEPRDETWKDLSPAERIEMVWTLTRLCMAWNNRWTDDEPRLQRTVTRLQRHHLIANKKSSARPQDIADVNELESGD
jgi:hypothetical protein